MKHWTNAERTRYRALALARKPWLHSTGPRTAEGKAVSAMNALKDGMQSAPALRLRRYIRSVALLARHKHE